MRIDYSNAIDEKNIARVCINGEWFDGIGYQGLMTVNTKTYIDEPTRANDGSIPNINDYATFIVPRCKLNFKYFNIEDYKRLCRVLNSANQFPVSYFDKQFGEFRTYMMYVEPEEMTKIYNVGSLVIGLFDYEISFIGTLNDLEKYTIKYDAGELTERILQPYSGANVYYENDVVYETANEVTTYYKYINKSPLAGKPLNDTASWKKIKKNINVEMEVSWGNSIKGETAEDLANFFVIPTGKTFVGWNTLKNGSGNNLKPNANWTVFEKATFYPMFE